MTKTQPILSNDEIIDNYTKQIWNLFDGQESTIEDVESIIEMIANEARASERQACIEELEKLQDKFEFFGNKYNAIQRGIEKLKKCENNATT